MDPRYPIGRFEPPTAVTHQTRHEWITAIAVLPRQMQEIVRDMSDHDLEATYRPGSWTVRQVIHHVADSHMNSYCRYRLALTEVNPVIKPYDEKAWAELQDAKCAPIDMSLLLLNSLHARWVTLLKSMDDAAFQRAFVHPELGPRNLDSTTALYAWHGRHHLAHIRMARGLSDNGAN